MASDEPNTVSLTFEPDSQIVALDEGETVLHAAWQGGIAIKSVCGGRGKCGTCVVELPYPEDAAAVLSQLSAQEISLLPRAQAGTHRLACMTHVHGPVTVHVPAESRAAATPPSKPYNDTHVVLAPTIERVTIEIDPPGAAPIRSLATRIAQALAAATGMPAPQISPAVMAEYSRHRGFDTTTRLTATLHAKAGVIQLRSGARTGRLGIAIDIGTTSIVVFLCDLGTGAILAARTASNPQAAFGEDVISRITHIHRDPRLLGRMQSLIVAEINRLLADGARSCGVDIDDVLDAVVVANPTMLHILMGVDPEPIGRGPYMSVWTEAIDIEAANVGLVLAPGARLFVFPMSSGYIGGDTIAAVLTRERDFFRGTQLLIDVGTNGEVVLSKEGVLTATSCATGPVYEGAHIACGVRASPGAIDHVWAMADGHLGWSAIPHPGRESDEPPIGICGSGVIACVAALAAAGIVDKDGTLDREHPGVRVDPASRAAEYVLVAASASGTARDIVVTQQDVRNVQLGKAALRAGIEILLRDQKVKRLDTIYLAGAFGNHLDPADILSIGMVPQVPQERIVAIGNAAGDGARMALFSTRFRERACRLARRTSVIELSWRSEFQDAFIDAIALLPDPLAEISEGAPA